MSNDIMVSEDQDISSNAALVVTKEIEAKITVALKFPRNIDQVEQEIKSMCSRVRFADGSTYSLPRGGKAVNGPSVHFAKGIAQLYGNIEHGHKIEKKGIDFTSGFAYAWDLQRNICIKKDFYMKHERKANNSIKKVTDPAEILEMLNAQISRAVRNCILEIMPWYLIEEAQEICANTLRAEAKKTPIEQRRDQAREAFRPYGVDDERIKKKFGKPFNELTDEDLFELKKGFTAIRDKFITVARWLGEEAETQDSNSSLLNETMKKKEETKEDPKAESAPLDEKTMLNDYNKLVNNMPKK